MSTTRRVVVAAVALALLVVLWGGVVEPRWMLDEQTEEAPVPDLPPAWEGQTVALLADLQVGMWLDNRGMIERAVETALEAEPALVLIAGDFVYKPDSAVIREAVALVAPLARGRAPVVAVLGNHDYSMMKQHSERRDDLAAYLEDQLETVGIIVLENETAAFPAPGGGEELHVVGIGSEWADRSDPAPALSSLRPDDPRIVLMHNGVAFRDMPAGSAGLALAAHTHGGQIRLPLLPSESWLDIARPREVVADGWSEASIGAPGNRLYVNRGLGFSLIPIRFMCRPELTLLTLLSADRTG